MKTENITAATSLQLPKLQQLAFGGESSMLFRITEDESLIDGLKLAGDLAGGIQQLCDRLDDCINDGALVYCDEIRALGFLANVVSALTRASSRSLQKSVDGGSGQ